MTESTRNFVCQYCERKFTMKHHLTRHIKEKRCKILKNTNTDTSIMDEMKSLKTQIAELRNNVENRIKNVTQDTDNETETSVDTITDIDILVEKPKLTDNCDIVIKNDEQIFKQVDEEAGYKFSKDHPMDGIRYEHDRNKYDCVIDGKHNRSGDLHKLCELKRVNLLGKIGHSVTEISQMCKKIIRYQNRYIISFWTKIVDDIVPLFDITHILSLIDVCDRSERRIKQQIEDINKFIYFEPNECGGYTVRELIDEKTMYQIVLDSRSDFSKTFKSDVSDLLIALRKSGEIQLAITNLPKKKQSKRVISQSHLSDLFSKEIIHVINGGMKTTNDNDMTYIKDLITTGEKIRLSLYNDEHVMYFFITNILSADNYVVCKIGYTSNINKRINTLVTEYEGTQFHLIGLKKIKNISDEESFHSMLKHRYSQLIYHDAVVKLVQKDELYIFDKCLWEEFSLLPDFHNNERTLSMSEIINEYKIGTINEEMMKLMLKIMESDIELEKIRLTNQ